MPNFDRHGCLKKCRFMAFLRTKEDDTSEVRCAAKTARFIGVSEISFKSFTYRQLGHATIPWKGICACSWSSWNTSLLGNLYTHSGSTFVDPGGDRTTARLITFGSPCHRPWWTNMLAILHLSAKSGAPAWNLLRLNIRREHGNNGNTTFLVESERFPK